MLKLSTNEFYKILPLFNNLDIQFPIAQAVIENNLDGDIYIDDIFNTQTALVISKVNWIYLLGNQNNELFNNQLFEFISTTLMKERDYFVWCGLSQHWQTKLNYFLGDNIKSFPRMNFTFNKNKPYNILTPLDEFEIRRIDKDLIKRACDFFPGINMFWNNGQNFLEKGIGFCALHEDKVVCVCQSLVKLNDKIEFDIFTHKDYRKLNVGYFTSLSLVDYCINNNLIPYWDCTVVNKPSYHLAKKLGFTENKEYSCYFWSKDL